MKITGKRDLAGAIKKAHASINEAAEAERQGDELTHTVMSTIYHLKYEEAKRVHADSAEPTPLIDAEAYARGVSRNRLANMIMDKHREWVERMAEIEVKRITAKRDVEKMRDTRLIADHHTTVFNGEKAAFPV